MSRDFTKFPFPGVTDPQAADLTAGIRYEPVTAGFVVVMLKVAEGGDVAEEVRAFARAVRAGAPTTGMTDISAYREVRRDELGGAIPFDQPILDSSLRAAERIHAADPDRYPTIGPALTMITDNAVADWIVLVEYETTEQAAAAAAAWNRGDESFAALVAGVDSHSLGSYRNTMRYATVSRDPDVIQFFNLFPGPGELDELWAGWQEALPWFFETGEFRSSFPLVGLDPEQRILLINYAHVDSVKHFFLGVCYDPTYLETVTGAYLDRGFALPMPFFCKIVPV